MGYVMQAPGLRKEPTMHAATSPPGDSLASLPTAEHARKALPKFEIDNWTGAYVLEIEAAEPCGMVPPLVRICDDRRSNSPLSFQHSMTAFQARQMAAQLMVCADAIDPPQVIEEDAQ